MRYEGVEKINHNIEPNYDYYKVCRDGAQSFGDDFLKCWKSTSFLANKMSSIDKWDQDSGL